MVVQSREGASSPAPDIGFARQLIRDKAENFANIRHYKDALGQLVTLYDALVSSFCAQEALRADAALN